MVSVGLLGIKVEDSTDYGRDPDPKTLLHVILQSCDEISLDAVFPGCMTSHFVGRNEWHVSIVTDIGMIHSYSGHCVMEYGVTEGRGAAWYARRARGFMLKEELWVR